MEKKIRLENEKKLWIVDLKGNAYTVISGSLNGSTKREGHTVFSSRKQWTDEQAALNKVAHLVKAKMNAGFLPKDKGGKDTTADVEKFISEVNAALVSTEKIERLGKAFNRAKEAAAKAAVRLDKIRARAKKAEERYNALAEKRDTAKSKLDAVSK